jgi:hypothetical protein
LAILRLPKSAHVSRPIFWGATESAIRVFFTKVIMRIGNADTIAEREHEKIDWELSYSPRLGAALKLILGDPAFVDERGNAFVQVHQGREIPQRLALWHRAGSQ